LLAIIICTNSGLEAAPRKLIYLDASVLPEGRLSTWRNLGNLGGSFVPVFRTQPTVEIIKNQKAVNLTAVDVLLRSTFPPPASLNGRQPFTLLVRVYIPELAQKGTILTWSQQPGAGAIFGLGKGLKAAFYHSDRVKLGYRKSYPEPGIWHLLAFVYDGKTIRVYVDGWLKAEASAVLSVKADKYFYLGGGGWLLAGRFPSIPSTVIWVLLNCWIRLTASWKSGTWPGGRTLSLYLPRKEKSLPLWQFL